MNKFPGTTDAGVVLAGMNDILLQIAEAPPPTLDNVGATLRLWLQFTLRVVSLLVLCGTVLGTVVGSMAGATVGKLIPNALKRRITSRWKPGTMEWYDAPPIDTERVHTPKRNSLGIINKFRNG